MYHGTDDDDSDYESGGLNLNPGHFSQLSMFPRPCGVAPAPDVIFTVAVMCLFQIVYQFYLYP
jgi:hypothetical protein